MNFCRHPLFSLLFERAVDREIKAEGLVLSSAVSMQATVLLCLQDIASGMDHIHSLGVLHRSAIQPPMSTTKVELHIAAPHAY